MRISKTLCTMPYYDGRRSLSTKDIYIGLFLYFAMWIGVHIMTYLVFGQWNIYTVLYVNGIVCVTEYFSTFCTALSRATENAKSETQ